MQQSGGHQHGPQAAAGQQRPSNAVPGAADVAMQQQRGRMPAGGGRMPQGYTYTQGGHQQQMMQGQHPAGSSQGGMGFFQGGFDASDMYPSYDNAGHHVAGGGRDAMMGGWMGGDPNDMRHAQGGGGGGSSQGGSSKASSQQHAASSKGKKSHDALSPQQQQQQQQQQKHMAAQHQMMMAAAVSEALGQRQPSQSGDVSSGSPSSGLLQGHASNTPSTPKTSGSTAPQGALRGHMMNGSMGVAEAAGGAPHGLVGGYQGHMGGGGGGGMQTQSVSGPAAHRGGMGNVPGMQLHGHHKEMEAYAGQQQQMQQAQHGMMHGQYVNQDIGGMYGGSSHGPKTPGVGEMVQGGGSMGKSQPGQGGVGAIKAGQGQMQRQGPMGSMMGSMPYGEFHSSASMQQRWHHRHQQQQHQRHQQPMMQDDHAFVLGGAGMEELGYGMPGDMASMHSHAGMGMPQGRGVAAGSLAGAGPGMHAGMQQQMTSRAGRGSTSSGGSLASSSQGFSSQKKSQQQQQQQQQQQKQQQQQQQQNAELPGGMSDKSQAFQQVGMGGGQRGAQHFAVQLAIQKEMEERAAMLKQKDGMPQHGRMMHHHDTNAAFYGGPGMDPSGAVGMMPGRGERQQDREGMGQSPGGGNEGMGSHQRQMGQMGWNSNMGMPPDSGSQRGGPPGMAQQYSTHTGVDDRSSNGGGKGSSSKSQSVMEIMQQQYEMMHPQSKNSMGQAGGKASRQSAGGRGPGGQLSRHAVGASSASEKSSGSAKKGSVPPQGGGSPHQGSTPAQGQAMQMGGQHVAGMDGGQGMPRGHYVGGDGGQQQYYQQQLYQQQMVQQQQKQMMMYMQGGHMMGYPMMPHSGAEMMAGGRHSGSSSHKKSSSSKKSSSKSASMDSNMDKDVKKSSSTKSKQPKKESSSINSTSGELQSFASSTSQSQSSKHPSVKQEHGEKGANQQGGESKKQKKERAGQIKDEFAVNGQQMLNPESVSRTSSLSRAPSFGLGLTDQGFMQEQTPFQEGNDLLADGSQSLRGEAEQLRSVFTVQELGQPEEEMWDDSGLGGMEQFDLCVQEGQQGINMMPIKSLLPTAEDTGMDEEEDTHEELTAETPGTLPATSEWSLSMNGIETDTLKQINFSVFIKDVKTNVTAEISDEGFFVSPWEQSINTAGTWSQVESGSWATNARWESFGKNKILEVYSEKGERMWREVEGTGTAEYKEVGCVVGLFSEQEGAVYRLLNNQVSRQDSINPFDDMEEDGEAEMLGNGSWLWEDKTLRWVPEEMNVPSFRMLPFPVHGDDQDQSGDSQEEQKQQGKGKGRKRDNGGDDSKGTRPPLPKKKKMNGGRAAVTESKPAAKPAGVSQAKRLAEKMRSTKAEAIASVTSNKPAGAKAAKKLRTSAPSTPATPNEGGNRSRGPSTPSETVSDVICNCSKICIEGTRGVMTCGKCKRLLHAKCVNISPGLAWLPYTCRACKDSRKRK